MVAILTGGGVPQVGIRRFVIHQETKEPVSLPTLRKHFRAELDVGVMIANAKLVNVAYNQAINGNTTMLIFLLKTRMGYKEPAQDVNLHQSYGDLVAAANAPKKPAAPLTLVPPPEKAA